MKWGALLSPAFLTGLLLLSTAAVGFSAAIRELGLHLQKLPIEAEGGLRFHTLPTAVDGWRREGSDTVMDKELLDSLGTENYVSRWYVEKDAPDAEKSVFELHVAYYTGTIDTVPHVPERCFVGGGVEIVGSSKIVDIPLDLSLFPPDPRVDEEEHGVVRRGRTRDHQYVRMPRDLENLRMLVTPFASPDGASMHAGYFFLANGGHVATADSIRELAFRLEERYAYYCKVQFMSPRVESAEELARIAADFLNEMLPEIMRRVPDWVEVEAGRYPRDADGAGEAGEGEA